MHRSTQIEDRDAALLAGDDASLSRSAWADNVIPFRLETVAAAPCLWAEAGEPLDEDVFDLGFLAVRLVGTFQFPRLLVVRQDQSQGAL